MSTFTSLLAASVLAVPAVTPVGALAAGPTAVTAAAVTWTTANSTATGDQDVPAIAMNRNGHVAVVWEDDRDGTAPEDDIHSEIYLRLFTNGTSAYEVKLSGGGTSGAAWRHISPDVGLDDRGNAVVVWAADGDGNGVYNIQYRVVSPAGAVLGSGQVNANDAGQQIWPKVAVDPDGAPTTAAVGFAVVWEDVQGSAPATVKAAGYTAAATKAYEVTASQTTGAHHRPDVAVSASGEALVVWDEDADANGAYNIGLTRLARSNGSVVLSRRTANTQSGGQQQRASIAANFAGDFTVAWESDHTGTRGVWERSFTAAAVARHAEVEVSTGTGATAPGVGIDDQDNVVVGWTVRGSTPDVWARGLNPDGTATGRLATQALSQTTTGRQEQMAVAASPWGEVAACYTDDNDGNTFDQVLLGLGATNSTWLMSAEELRRLKARAATTG
ncbi:hypothetical protein [Micromonospora sp. WMMD812]|uniref:hypothetical protein n=1 Tax=Micromonospora sp. WMMD812 TaxID=3015152 RepID=UPI00248CE171|nr:hypothetical protein [Micromonospora sp. WMMD812]WBB70046.1 hypothetical protein O7603_12065 [Micromonospora sp. WMMD812]